MSKILDKIINYIGTNGVFKDNDGKVVFEDDNGNLILSSEGISTTSSSLDITVGVGTSNSKTHILNTSVVTSSDLTNKEYVDNRTQDYILEQYLSTGAAGDWSYRKWNSGLFECWASHTLSLTSDGQTGSNYFSKSVYAQLPKLTGIGYSTTGAIAEVTGGNNVAWVGNVGLTGGVPTGTPSDSNTAGTVWFRVIRSIAIPASGTFRIYVMCRWYNT